MLEGLGPAELEGHDDVEDLVLGDVGEGLLDVVGQRLRDRAEVGVDVLLVAGHVAEVGQEDVVGALLPHVLDGAVGDLGGEAVGALGPRDALVVHFLREEGPDAQAVEEPGVEGIEGVHREALGDADDVVALGDEVRGIRAPSGRRGARCARGPSRRPGRPWPSCACWRTCCTCRRTCTWSPPTFRTWMGQRFSQDLHLKTLS